MKMKFSNSRSKIVLFCLLLSLFSCKQSSNISNTESPNVILIVIDSLRSDHLGAYGYNRSITPTMDRFAKRSLQLCNVVAQGSWTKSTTASLMTGLYPKSHKTVDMYDRLDPKIPLLSTRLKEKGYTTWAFSANSIVIPETGFAQGFDLFLYEEEILEDSSKINSAIMKRLLKLGSQDKLFLYIHYMDPHFPYLPKESCYSKKNTIVFDLDFFGQNRHLDYVSKPRLKTILTQQLKNAYDDEVRYNDKMLGQLLNNLTSQHLAENALLIITSDHGEELLDHNGVTHGHTLYNELISIPLMMCVPDKRKDIIDRLVEQIDIAPTIIELAKAKTTPEIEGSSLFDHNIHTYAFSELDLKGKKATSITTRSEKLLEHIQLWEAEDTIKWFSKQAFFTPPNNTFAFDIKSLQKPRILNIFADHLLIKQHTIFPHWITITVDLPNSEVKQVRLVTEGECHSPFELNINRDMRCLSFCLRNTDDVAVNKVGEIRLDYYHLDTDPIESQTLPFPVGDNSNNNDLLTELRMYEQHFNRSYRKHVLEPSKSIEEQLKRLGYLE